MRDDSGVAGEGRIVSVPNSEQLRWRVNNSTINYLPYIKCLLLLVVRSLTAKLEIQVLYMASSACVTNLDTMLQEIAWRAVVEFYNFSSRFTRTVREPHTPFL